MVTRKRFCLLGHPVAHSLSPAMFSAAFAELDMPCSYGLIDVATRAELAELVEDLRSGVLHGANVTLPYKRTVLGLADVVDPLAQHIGAANVLIRTPDERVVAYNTDAVALATEIETLRGHRGPGSAVIVGAGGAALAALWACKHLGLGLVGVTTRSWVNSESLVTKQTAEYMRDQGALTAPWPGLAGETAPTSRSSLVLRLQWCELASTADVLIQASSAGLGEDESGEDVAAMVPWDMVPKHAVAIDVVYGDRETPFLREARAHGIRGVNGLGMLVGQAARTFELWTGQKAPTAVMRSAAERALAQTRGS